MKVYRVWFKRFDGWFIDGDAKDVNLLWAESVAEYHKRYGREVRIEEREI